MVSPITCYELPSVADLLPGGRLCNNPRIEGHIYLDVFKFKKFDRKEILFLKTKQGKTFLHRFYTG